VHEPGVLEWPDDNARRFGFRRTVRAEPWHWEYVARSKRGPPYKKRTTC
jgi:LAS superfamily LD-carboxypeptidase LdcB